jgi:hypothetical protein
MLVVVVCICNPTQEAEVGRAQSEANPGQKHTLLAEKVLKQKRLGL